MLFGTRKVNVFSSTLISSSAVNQRLKVSPLTCGFSTADNLCQSSTHLLSILVNTVTQLPHGQLSKENGSLHGQAPARACLDWLQEGVQKNCANCGNTRENVHRRSQDPFSSVWNRNILSQGYLPRSTRHSFVGFKVSQKYSHFIQIN